MGRAAGEFAHDGVRLQAINVCYLLPEVTRGPAHLMQYTVDPGDMAPVAAAAWGAEKLLQPIVAKYHHRIGPDHEVRPFVAYALRFQLFRREQMQEILLAVTLVPIVGMCWAEQLPPLRTAFAAALI